MAAVKLAPVLVLAACARFDLSEPIELVPDRSWSTADVDTLAAAAECWVLGFGVPFEVAERPSRAQFATVEYNDFLCWTGQGRFTPGKPAAIDVCPFDEGTWPKVPQTYRHPLLAVLVHELGHATGIRTEGTGPFSVMGGNAAFLYALSPHAFTDEDRQLFADVAGGTELEPACADVMLTIDGRCTCE